MIHYDMVQMILYSLWSMLRRLLPDCGTVHQSKIPIVEVAELTISFNCEFASLNCFSRYLAFLTNCSKSSPIVFSNFKLSLSSVSLSLITNLLISLGSFPMTDNTYIFPTPLYSLTSGSSFGIAVISLIVRFKILRSFSFDCIWARTRDSARWDAIA